MTRTHSSSWQVALAEAHHVPGIRRLFHSVFGHEMSETHWHWKYGEGRGVGVVVMESNEVVAFFGGTERRVLFEGDPIVAMQCGDSMVAPSRRGILTRKGPFYLSVTAFLGRFVGTGLPYLLSYGFPNARAMRLAQRLGLYDDVGAMLEVEWHPRTDIDLQARRFDFVDPEDCRLVDSLWQEMAGEFKDRAIGVRDIAYLKQRFLDNPTLSYEFHLVVKRVKEDAEDVLGLLITRQTDQGLLLVDMVGASRNMCHLVNYARHRAGETCCNKLYGWITARDLPLIAETDPILEKPALRLPLGVYSPGLKAEEVREKWFFLCGDSDFL